MSSGLPVICSDWNGYRDTVIDGLSGFLIPTSVFSPIFESSSIDFISSIDAHTDYSAFLASTSVIIDEDYAVKKLLILLLHLLYCSVSRRMLCTSDANLIGLLSFKNMSLFAGAFTNPISFF